MSLTLEFDRSVSLAKARQIARRVLDQTRIENLLPLEEDALDEAKLTCSSLRRIIRWSPDVPNESNIESE